MLIFFFKNPPFLQEMLRTFEARYTDQIKFFELLQSDDPVHGWYTWLPGLEKYPKFTDTWRGWGNARRYSVQLGVDSQPHSGYPNDPSLFLDYIFYLDWPLNVSCNNNIWCLGAATDGNGDKPDGLAIPYGRNPSTSWNSNTYSSLYLDFPNRYNIYMLHYSLAERMKMLIDPNYKPTYK